MNRLIGQAAQQYQPKDRERFIQYVQQDPMAAAQLRAPLYEDKVVDFLFSKAEITERAVTRAELEADLESEEGHVHGPGCGHDHARRQAGQEGRKRRRPRRRRQGRHGQAGCRSRAKKPAKPAKPLKARSPSPPSRSRTAPAPSPPSQEGRPAKKAPARQIIRSS